MSSIWDTSPNTRDVGEAMDFEDYMNRLYLRLTEEEKSNQRREAQGLPPSRFGGGGLGAGTGGGSGSTIGGIAGPGGSAAANSAAGLSGAGTTAGTTAATGGSMAWYANPQLWGAVLGAGSSYLDANAAKKQGQNAGKVDITSSRTPWGPGEEYITDALGRGKELISQPRQPFQGGVGGGAQYQAQGADGYRSAANADALTNRANAGHPLYGASNQYVSGTLSGQGQDANQYRAQAGEMFGNMNNQHLNDLIEMLSGKGGIGGGMGGFTGGGGMSSVYNQGGGAGTGPVGAAQYIKDILNEKYLTENPHSQAVIEAANRRVMDDFASKQIPGVNTKYAGAGALGSEAWNEAMRRSTGAVTDSLADNASSVLYRDYNDRMGDLMQALGYGTQMDMHAMDDATRRAGIGASAGSAANAAATQRYIAQLGALSDAVGSSVDLTKTGAFGMAGLADMMSGDQRFALGMVPDLTGMDIRDLESAFGANFGLDQLGQQDRQFGANLNSQNRNQAANRDWQQYVYGQEAPWNDLMRYGDLISALTGQYGDVREVGIDQRNVSPYTGSPVGQAVAGGLAGWAMGDEYRQRQGQG